MLKILFCQKEHAKLVSSANQLTIKALYTNSSSLEDRYEIAGLRS